MHVIKRAVFRADEESGRQGLQRPRDIDKSTVLDLRGRDDVQPGAVLRQLLREFLLESLCRYRDLLQLRRIGMSGTEHRHPDARGGQHRLELLSHYLASSRLG